MNKFSYYENGICLKCKYQSRHSSTCPARWNSYITDDMTHNIIECSKFERMPHNDDLSHKFITVVKQ